MPEYNDPQSNKVTSDTKPLKKGKTEVVKDIISKGRTMTGQKPDEIILNPVLEAKEKRAVFAFGRFNPPTIGHEKLIHKVEDTAKSQGAEAHIIASHTEGNAKNPIPKEKKVEYLKRIAAEGTNVTGSSSELPTLLHHLANLHKAGVQHITMVAGDDRVKEYHDLIHKYNGVEGRHGTFNFKSINVVSAGARDPDAEGAEGMSGTKMREHARSGNTKEFKKGLPKALHPHAKEIMDQIKSVKEEVDDLFNNFIIETAIDKIGQIYDQVIQESYDEDKENAKIKVVNHSNTHFRDDGSSARTILFKHDTPGEPKSSKVKEDINNTFEAWVDDENPEPKYREVVNRHGQDRKKIVLVPRGDADRKDCDRPYRQQEIQKKIVDEGKKMSPWDKMVKAMPKLRDSEERAQAAKAGLQQAGKDYQAILDREAEAKKKTNESVNSIGGVRGMGHVSGSPDGDGGSYVGNNIADADTRDNIIKAHINAHFAMHMSDQKVTKEEKEVWDKPAPKGKKGHMTTLQKARAKARAKAAGRPYPNLVDNMAVMKEEETLDEKTTRDHVQISSEMQKQKRKQYYRKRRQASRHLTQHSKNVALGMYRNTALGHHQKGRFVTIRVNEDSNVIKQLEDKLNVATDKSYDGIDQIMRQVANENNIDVHDLHDMWVKETGITPDQYVKEEKYATVNEMGKKGTFRPISPGVQNLRTAQAATRGDKALDKEYHYGTTRGGVSPIAGKRREQGFGAVANYNSAQAALTAKKQGANPKGQDAAIHKGWGKTVDQMPAANPEKQAARKKLQQTPFSSLSKDEQEKDTVLRKGITKEAKIYFGKNRERYVAQRKPLSPEAEKILRDAETKISQSAVPSQQAIKDRQTKTRADYEKEIPSDYKPKLHKD